MPIAESYKTWRKKLKDKEKPIITCCASGMRSASAKAILIAGGYFLNTPPNRVMMLIGIVPLSAGIFDFCLLAPLFGYYFSGKKTRAAVAG